MKKTFLLAGVLVIVSLALYGRTVTYDFVWDDPFLLERLDGLTTGGGLKKVFTSDFRMRDPLGYYRPVTNITLYIDGAVFGRDPFGYHLTNVILNAACTVVLFLFLFGASASLYGAFLGSLLFALHPVHVESVAFVSGRTDLLAALFVLLACTIWVYRRRRPAGKLFFVLLGSLCYLLGLLSKESALMLPPALLALLFAMESPRPSGSGIDWRRELPWIAGLSVALGLYGILRFIVAGVAVGTKGMSPGGASPGALGSLQTALLKLLAYIKMMVFPFRLSAWYTIDQIGLSILSLSALAVICILLIYVAARKSSAWSLWVIGWFLLFLFPSLVGSSGNVVANRYLYLPSAALCFLVGLALDGTRPGRRRQLAALAAAATAFLFTFQTVTRTAVWKNNLSLFRSIVATSPGSPQAHGNLGYLLQEEGLLEEAIAEYEKALAINRNMPRTYFDLGEACFSLGRWMKAAESYRAATLFPRNSAIDYRRLFQRWGEASARVGKWNEAVPAFKRALELNPGKADLHYSLGRALARTGRQSEARLELERALSIDPSHTEALRELGMLRP